MVIMVEARTVDTIQHQDTDRGLKKAFLNAETNMIHRYLYIYIYLVAWVGLFVCGEVGTYLRLIANFQKPIANAVRPDQAI